MIKDRVREVFLSIRDGVEFYNEDQPRGEGGKWTAGNSTNVKLTDSQGQLVDIMSIGDKLRDHQAATGHATITDSTKPHDQGHTLHVNPGNIEQMKEAHAALTRGAGTYDRYHGAGAKSAAEKIAKAIDTVGVSQDWRHSAPDWDQEKYYHGVSD